MFLGTSVTDLLKKKLGSPNSFLKKTRKTAIFSAVFSVTIIRHSCHGNANFIRILLVCDTSYYVLQF